MHVDWRFTGDGLLAFVGGAFAIIAVLLSNRRSRINLEKQLEVENKTRSEELERQARAVAKAILFDINNFYCFIAGLYCSAEAYLNTLRDYKAESEKYFQNCLDEVAEEKARTFLKQMKSTGPEIAKLTHLVCEELCRLACVEFSAPSIAVAAEGLSTQQIARSLEGANAQTH